MASSKTPHASCGLDYCSVPDLPLALSSATTHQYEFICVPIVHPRYKREYLRKCKDREENFTRPDLVLSSTDWSTYIVGKLSPYINVDSGNMTTMQQSMITLEQELDFATHLGIPAVLLKLNSYNCVNLAKYISNKIQNFSMRQIWTQVPLKSPAREALVWRSDLEIDVINDPVSVEDSTWNWWNKFHSLCNLDKKVSVVLELTADLPLQAELTRWLGEPVKCLIVPTSIFLTNKKGYPVLSKPHQHFIRSFVNLHVQVIISGARQSSNIISYKRYMEFLWQSEIEQKDPILEFARGYEDFLQCPLQPLSDNLECFTYEVFEKDPVKYKMYGQAVQAAMSDIAGDSEIVVMVVGAGRGPLVRATLQAAERAERKVKIYAVEKNPNAVITLIAQKEEFWKDQVTVVSSDMRDFHPHEKADILVSELLGSFGDNELSPECLDGAQNFLKEDGVSIPASYTSYIVPVQTSKLYNEVRSCKDREKHSLAHFETPYVVHQQNKYLISSIQSLFTFYHPNFDEPMNNARYKKLVFGVEQDCLLHGFSGYFDTYLYKNISLSILPHKHSPGMFSWFPIFFPIINPVQLKAGDVVEAHFWRCVNKFHVWYEWCITKPVVLPIHNPCGRSYKIGLR